MFKYLTVLFLLQGFFLPLIAEQESYQVFCPIDWTKEEQVNLFVAIPGGFKAIQPLDCENKDSIEFIPVHETPTTWTERITVKNLIGRGIQSYKMIDFVKNSVIALATSAEPWDLSHKHSDYSVTSLGLDYQFSDKKEMLGAVYYSGLYDCSGAEYTIRPSSCLTSDQAKEKIENFFSNCVKELSTAE